MRSADALGDERLLELFNRAYADYYLPLRLESAAFRAMVETCDLELASSPVADADGAPAGFALLGVRGSDGWIGGMAVAPEARRRGLGRAVTEAAVEAARARGVQVVRLEVLEQNEPAVQLYRQLGFEHERDLDVWALAGAGEAVAGASPVDVADAHRWIASHRHSREPWQRADATLAHLRRRDPPPAALELRRDGERTGTVVYTGPAVLQLAAVDAEAVRGLVEAVRAQAGSLRWLNAPADEPRSAAMEALGATRVARQHELVLPLSA